MDPKIAALSIFIITYILIATGKIDRTIVAMWGALLLFLVPILTPQGLHLGLMSQADMLAHIDWEALGLIIGMFTLVSILRESGFFRYLGLFILKIAKFDVLLIFIIYAFMAAILSAFMSSITIMLFMATLTLETCSLLKISPVPFLIFEITSANIGGCATMVGDPPSIIVGVGCNFTFADFFANMAPIALIIFIVNLLFFYFSYSKLLNEKRNELKEKHKEYPIDPKSAIGDKQLMKSTLIFFVFTTFLLIFQHILNISIAFIAILGASLSLVFGGKKMPEIIEKLDWRTIIFFTCLFIMVGGLDKAGVLKDFASAIGHMSKGSLIATSFIILWSAAFLSSVIDNVPFAALMVPVIKSLSSVYNFPLAPLAWSLILGTNIGGNGTPIGASANVVGLAVAEKAGYKVTWKEYCSVALPSMLITVGTGMIFMYFRYLR